MAKLGRNESCHCNSGKKYKKCCLAKDEEEARAAHSLAEAERQQAAAELQAEQAASGAEDGSEADPVRQPRAPFAANSGFRSKDDRAGLAGVSTGRSRGSGHR